jgi:hypothetical protein
MYPSEVTTTNGLVEAGIIIAVEVPEVDTALSWYHGRGK